MTEKVTCSQDYTDSLDLVSIAKEFVAPFEERKSFNVNYRS